MPYLIFSIGPLKTFFSLRKQGYQYMFINLNHNYTLNFSNWFSKSLARHTCVQVCTGFVDCTIVSSNFCSSSTNSSYFRVSGGNIRWQLQRPVSSLFLRSCCEDECHCSQSLNNTANMTKRAGNYWVFKCPSVLLNEGTRSIHLVKLFIDDA